jgi:hypothetical protein
MCLIRTETNCIDSTAAPDAGFEEKKLRAEYTERWQIYAILVSPLGVLLWEQVNLRKMKLHTLLSDLIVC